MIASARVGQKIRYERKKKGFTQAQVALSVEMDPSHLGKIERGQVGLTIDTLQKIADFLRIDMKKLV